MQLEVFRPISRGKVLGRERGLGLFSSIRLYLIKKVCFKEPSKLAALVNLLNQMQSKEHVNYIDPCYMPAFVVGVPGGAVQTKTLRLFSSVCHYM